MINNTQVSNIITSNFDDFTIFDKIIESMWGKSFLWMKNLLNSNLIKYCESQINSQYKENLQCFNHFLCDLCILLKRVGQGVTLVVHLIKLCTHRTNTTQIWSQLCTTSGVQTMEFSASSCFLPIHRNSSLERINKIALFPSNGRWSPCIVFYLSRFYL